MGDVIAQEDIYLPQPGYPNAKIKVAAKGDPIEERWLAEAEVLAKAAPAPVAGNDQDPGDGSPDYESMNVPALKKLVADRGLTVEGTKKANLVAALEDADEADAAGPAAPAEFDADEASDEDLVALAELLEIEHDGVDRDALLEAIADADSEKLAEALVTLAGAGN